MTEKTPRQLEAKRLADEAGERIKLSKAIVRDFLKLKKGDLTAAEEKKVRQRLERNEAKIPDVNYVERDGSKFFINTNPHLSREEIAVQIQKILSDRVASLTLSSVVIPERKEAAGLLIKSTSIVWQKVIQLLSMDWSLAFQISPERWEEIIAGAYSEAGYAVTLTPRSGDYGRDVIAVSAGVGCVKILGSMKAYKPGHLVKHDDVRALLGVLSGEHNASKGIITTTSGFAPRIMSDPFIKPFLPTRLELMDGLKLQKWLADLMKNKK
jgi:restriction system protein